MMCFVVLDISDHIVDMAFGIGECAKTFLPGKFFVTEAIVIDPFGIFRFYNLYQLGHVIIRPETNEQVQMIRHRINLQHFVRFVLDDTSDVPVQLVFPGSVD